MGSPMNPSGQIMANSGDRSGLALFGGKLGWKADDWISQDDTVRGGQSQSYLECTDRIGRFYGTLDIKTLGGAGFASQRTTGEDREWDLSNYAGIQICVAKGDKKRYTFNLKDSLLPSHPDTGRDQSSISYECDFELPPQTVPGHAYDRSVFIPWCSFVPTYRGRPQPDAPPLDRTKIRRLSIMMRSFFGSQEGDFSLSIRSITALRDVPPTPPPKDPEVMDVDRLEKNCLDRNHDHDLRSRFDDPTVDVNFRFHRRVLYVFAVCMSCAAAYWIAQRFHPFVCESKVLRDWTASGHP